MSVFIISTFRTTDFAEWKAKLDRRQDRYRELGLCGYQIFRAVDDADEVSMVVEFQTLQGAERALQDIRGMRADFEAAGLVDYPAVFIGEMVEEL